MNKLCIKVAIALLIVTGQATKAQAGHMECGQIKIAIVDTGLNLRDPRFKYHLCENGHKNFVKEESIDDINGHGTHIAGIIQQYAGNANYCILIYKYYQSSASGISSIGREVLAFQEAVNNGADIINFSGGGPSFDESEFLVIKDNPNTTFVVAAGNDGKNIDMPGNEYYPASLFLSNMEVVGGIDLFYNKTPTSNYSNRIKDKELGKDVLSYLPNNKIGYLSGTSMATAIFSGKLVARYPKTCKYRE